MVTLGGEVTVDYALAIKKMFGRKRTFVAAYCNDVMAYIPSKRVWDEGGYEGASAMVYYGQPSRWSATVEQDVLGAVKRTVAKTLAHELPRIPPKSPEEAKKTFDLAPGQIQYVNNFRLAHCRTEYEDAGGEDDKRHLVRIFLRDAGRRSFMG